MTIVIYSQLGELLRTRRLAVADLARRLRRYFGPMVNMKTLYRLTRPGPIRHADIEVALAAAAILGVALDDLFTMYTLPDGGDGTVPALDPDASRRLADLFERQSARPLAADERDERDRLVLDYSRLPRDHELRHYAGERGVTFEQSRDRLRERVIDIVEHERATYPAAAPPALVR